MDSLPIYLQISQFIENEILKDNLQADERVPSTNEFAKALDINPATAGRGLNALVEEGIIYKQRGVGMFVSKDAMEIIVRKRLKVFLDESLPHFVQEAKKLGVEEEELINLIREKYQAGDSR